MPGAVDSIGTGTGLANTDYGNIHMGDWNTATPWLKSIQTAASVTTTLVSATSAAAGPIGGAVGGGLNMVLGAISDGIEAADTQKTVAGLKKLLKGEVSRLPNGTAKEDLETVIALAIKKKSRHRDIAISQSATLGISKLGTAAYRAGRALHKTRTGTKGASREDASNKLIALLNDNNQAVKSIAQNIVVLIAKQNFDQILKSTIKDAFRS